MFQERNQIFNFLHRPLRSSSPLHHVLVSSSSTVLPDVQGVVGERVLGLVIVVGSQQRSRPDAHIVRRQRPTKLGRQTLGMDELVERVQVVAVEEDLRTVSEKVNLVTSDISARITGAGTPAHPLPGLVFEERLDDGVHGVNVPGLIHKMDSSEASRETVLRKGEQSRSFHIVFNVNLADREEDGGRGYLEAFYGQFEDVGRELGRLFEGEVAPVNDEDEAIDLELRIFYQDLQREQDGPQDVSEGVPVRGRRGC